MLSTLRRFGTVLAFAFRLGSHFGLATLGSFCTALGASGALDLGRRAGSTCQGLRVAFQKLSFELGKSIEGQGFSEPQEFKSHCWLYNASYC